MYQGKPEAGEWEYDCFVVGGGEWNSRKARDILSGEDIPTLPAHKKGVNRDWRSDASECEQ